MGLNVKERGEAVATFRYVQVKLMEMLAGWTPTSPEMEAKLLFGEHIWDFSQHADALGKRTHELRLPLQHSLRPVDAYVDLLEEIGQQNDTAKRLAGIYDALLPGLASRYRVYLQHTDSLMDAPTVRILERMSDAQSRMIRQCQKLRSELPALGGAKDGWVDDLVGQKGRIQSLVA